MKNFVALFALVLTVSMAVAGSTFTVEDYKAGYATIPAFYKGTLAVTLGWSSDACACKAKKLKDSYPAFLAICQPCLDCYYDCRVVDGTDYDEDYKSPNNLEPKGVTGYMYYILGVDKKAKEVYYFVIDIAENAAFVNYNYAMANKQVALFQTTRIADEPMFALIGTKDAKTWKIGKNVKLTASVTKSFDGAAFFATAPAGNDAENAFQLADGCKEDNEVADGIFANLTLKLNRDDAATKKLMGEMVSGICGNIPCEDFIEGAFDTNVLEKSYKKYDAVEVDYFFEEEETEE